jgi:TRAP-type C4-dicarboxylate transport system permease small subunit
MRQIEVLNRLFDHIERLFLVVAVLCLTTMLAGNTANIVIRNVTGSGLSFVFPWTSVLFVWMTFFVFFVIYRRKRDIAITFAIERLGPRGQFAAWVTCKAATIFVLAVLLIEAPGILALQVGDASEFVEMERFWLSVPFFISCILISIDVIIELAHAAVTRQVDILAKPRH